MSGAEEVGGGAEGLDSIDNRLVDLEWSVFLRTVLILDNSLLPTLFPFSSRPSSGEPCIREAISTKDVLRCQLKNKFLGFKKVRPRSVGMWSYSMFEGSGGSHKRQRCKAKNGPNGAGLQTLPSSQRRGQDDQVLSRMSR